MTIGFDYIDIAMGEADTVQYRGRTFVTKAALDKALTENAKLQKVCKRMHDHIKDSCDVCDEYYCSSWDEDNERCVFDSYMHELGIEVGE